ncbi:MAG: type II toxin-antitoxin system VapC family toxin [Bacteroidales bacterium]
MQVVVNDTNIFIDLHTVNLLSLFFQLPIQVHTLDMVINELTNTKQKEAILQFSVTKHLIIKQLSGKDILEVLSYSPQNKGNLSLTDCAVCHYAKSNDYTLLTGDKKLRKTAQENNLKIAGILFVFDLLVEHKKLIPATASLKLQQLYNANKRLPRQEIEKRISKWG